VRSRGGRKGGFGTLGTRRRLRCWRYALRGAEAVKVEAAGGGRRP